MANQLARAILASTVGTWFPEVRVGMPLAPGQRLGVLVRMDRELEVRVPAGVEGVAHQVLPARTWVEHGRSLVALAAAQAGVVTPIAAALPEDLVFVRAPTDGMVWLQAEPGDPPFVREGAFVGERDTVLLLEVMKTWSPVRCPVRGVVERVLVQDGAAVEAGAPLIAVRAVAAKSAAS